MLFFIFIIFFLQNISSSHLSNLECVNGGGGSGCVCCYSCIGNNNYGSYDDNNNDIIVEYHLDWKIVPYEKKILKQEMECCICFEEFFDVRTPCAHNFHWNCLKKWININQTCPICRFNFTKITSLEKIIKGLQFYELAGIPILHICRLNGFREGIEYLEKCNHKDAISPYDCAMFQMEFNFGFPEFLVNHSLYYIFLFVALIFTTYNDFLSKNRDFIFYYSIYSFKSEPYLLWLVLAISLLLLRNRIH